MLKIHLLASPKGGSCLIVHPNRKLSLYNSREPHVHSTQDESMSGFIKSKYPKQQIEKFFISFPNLQHMIGIKEIVDKNKIKELCLPDLGFKRNVKLKSTIEKKINLNKKFANQPKISFLSSSVNPNKLSILWPPHKNKTEGLVIKINHKKHSILLGGDATVDSWKKIIKHHGKEILNSTVLHAPLNGSIRGINRQILHLIKPDFVVIPVLDTEYISSLYFDHNFKLYLTSCYKNINITIEDQVTIDAELRSNSK